ncbi:hypothetical protein B0H12DRAFT_834192 [Mycena haematopus]|nr:hypothetical protein B0H12DRAFT_834192 [Mycena haematopus]
MVPDVSKSHKTAEYRAKYLSPVFAEFSYYDDGVVDDLKNIYRAIVADKMTGKFSEKSRSLWIDMQTCLRTPPDVTSYTDENFVTRAAVRFNELAGSLFTDILTWPTDEPNTDGPPITHYTIHSGSPNLKFPQREDQSSFCSEHYENPVENGPRIISGVSIEHKTYTVLMHHVPDLRRNHFFSNVRQKDARAMIFKVGYFFSGGGGGFHTYFP